MLFELKVSIFLSWVKILETLRIITPEDADDHRDLLVRLSVIRALIEGEKEREGWSL